MVATSLCNLKGMAVGPDHASRGPLSISALPRAGRPPWGRRALVLGLATLVAGRAAAQSADIPPVPKPRQEKVPPAPAGGRYVWQPGSWEWDETAAGYAWRHGRYVTRRPGTTRYVPGRWALNGGAWVWRRGRWR